MNPFVSNAPLNPRHNESILTRKEKIEEVISQICEGEYCLILGPKYSGRTTLLRAVKDGLQAKPGNIPVLVHPRELHLAGEKAFFESVARFIEKTLRHEKAWPASLTLEKYRFYDNPDVFNRFLDDVLQALGQKLVLLFDSIERIPPELLTRLGWIAHAYYETGKTKPSYRYVSFNFAGSISLRYLTHHMNPKVSPLRICHSVVLRDLSAREATNFLENINNEYQLGFTADGVAEILQYVGGDTNLLQRVAGLALDAAGSSGVDRQAVKRAVESLLKDDHTEESLAYGMKRVEDDRQVFDLILHLLHRQLRPYEPSELEATLYDRYGITYQEMIGMLVLERVEGQPRNWAFRNKLTELYLQRHFTPQHIVRVYMEEQDLEAAVAHCGPLLENVRAEFETNIERFNDHDLKAVLTAFTARIRAEDSHEFAYELMAKLLAQGFGCSTATFYDYISPENKLAAVTFLKPVFHNDGAEIKVTGVGDRNSIEVKAYKSQLYAAKSEGDELHVAIPLTNVIGEVTAVITIHTQSRGNSWSRLDLKVQVIKGALNAINKALNQVEDKRKKHIISSVTRLRPTKAAMRVFVAHEFNEELLKNLRDHLGRVSQELNFIFVDQTNTGGLLFARIMDEIRSSRLGLYEMSTPNNNVSLECGIGIGLNLPGILFLRTAKRSSKAVLARMPQLLDGLLPFTYHDYTGILENINAKLDRVLESYLDHQSDPSFIHFLGLRIPDRGKKLSYAAVLDHDQFGDQRDYRKTVEGVLGELGLKAVYPLDQQVSIDRYLTEASTGSISSQLIDVMCLLQHAEVVIGRVENVKTPRAAQIFVALGYCLGRNEIPGAKPIRMQMNLLRKSPTKALQDVPSDIKGWNKYFIYSNFEELKTILKSKLAGTDLNETM